MISRHRTPYVCAILVLLGTGAAAAQSAGIPPAPGNPFLPPPCTGTVFTDIDCSTGFDAWIEQYASDQITAGCDASRYCPTDPVTRAQMAVFVEKAMRGTAEWSPGDLGNFNTALGKDALLSNTTARTNTAVGTGALQNQSYDNGGTTWDSSNTAIGFATLTFNQPTSTSNARDNTAIGSDTLFGNSTGSRNTGVGAATLFSNFTASDNTAVGFSALGTTSTGFDNTAVGSKAGDRQNASVTGYSGSPVLLVSNQTGSYNTFLGITGATAQVDNCTAVGMDAYCDATDQVRLGNFFVNSIGGKVAWSALSDARAKRDVEDLRLGLPLVLALRPVSFRYKGGNGRTDMGFVAQEVNAILGEGYNVVDAGGDSERTLSLRYTELIAPMVKAIHELNAQVEMLRAELDALRSERGR